VDDKSMEVEDIQRFLNRLKTESPIHDLPLTDPSPPPPSPSHLPSNDQETAKNEQPSKKVRLAQFLPSLPQFRSCA
jgi:hypothetical protein